MPLYIRPACYPIFWDYVTRMTGTTLTTEALITLRYWAPGPFADDYCGGDAEKHEAAAYDGMAECIDDGLLSHSASAYGESYSPTQRGWAVLADMGDDSRPELFPVV